MTFDLLFQTSRKTFIPFPTLNQGKTVSRDFKTLKECASKKLHNQSVFTSVITVINAWKPFSFYAIKNNFILE